MVENLLIKFEDAFIQKWDCSLKLSFVRHGKTAFNDGSFLGRRDPELLESIEPLENQFQAVYTSPLKRAIMTAKELSSNNNANLDSRLSEINYGKAEGLFLEDLKINFLICMNPGVKGKMLDFRMAKITWM